MVLHGGKEYYPIEVSEIYGKGQKVIYDRKERNKSYVYVAVENIVYEGE